LLLVGVNWIIFERERLLEDGRVVVLELAPVDPRSLMQGDYMALRFKVADEVFGRGRSAPNAPAQDGRIVVRTDARGLAAYVRHDAGEPLAAGEARLRYRVREQQVKFATNAYFFQEGSGGQYARARYGEFRVAPEGDMLLTHLRGENLERIIVAKPGR
jgi:uncharacterized membrane-anchored protein